LTAFLHGKVSSCIEFCFVAAVFATGSCSISAAILCSSSAAQARDYHPAIPAQNTVKSFHAVFDFVCGLLQDEVGLFLS
jgi:hypothetical protein